MTKNPPANQMRCSGCAQAKDTKRLPIGWHKDAAGNVLCGKCWHDRYILRAVTIPVAGPVDCEWAELRARLKACFAAATRLSNWAVSELAKADVTRSPDMAKLPKQTKPYLYPGARALCPELDTGSLVAILHAVEGRYAKRRYDVVWLAKESLPNYRYDRAVYPVRSQDWRAIRGDDGQRIVSVRLAGQRLSLRLRGGHQFRRQAKAFDKLLDGDAIASELSLYEIGGSNGDHRPGTNGRDGGGQRVAKRLMCKMCMWLPKEPRPERQGILFVSTGADCLLFALNAKNDRLWTINRDDLPRWIAAHQARLQRWSEDNKAEVRRSHRNKMAARREAACRKHRHRLDSAVKETAAQVVAYAQRYRFAEIRLIDAGERWLPSFPWAALFDRINVKADELGIVFTKEPYGAGTNDTDATG